MLLSRISHMPRYWFSGPVLNVALALLLVGLLGACGFRPLYGKHGDGTVPAEQYLARIDILQIKDRIGQQLHNNLLNRLNPKGASGSPLYALSVTLSESIANLGVKKSAVVTRGNLRVSATYSLTLLHEDQQNSSLTSGTVLAISSYDIPQAQYAARAALSDARNRAVKEIADDISTRLAVYFKQNANKL